MSFFSILLPLVYLFLCRVMVTSVLADRHPGELHIFRNYDLPSVHREPPYATTATFKPLTIPQGTLGKEVSHVCWLFALVCSCYDGGVVQCIYTTTGWCQGKQCWNPTLGGFTSWDWVTIKLRLSMCVIIFLSKLSSAVLSECQPCCCSRMGGWGCVDSRIHRRATQKA